MKKNLLALIFVSLVVGNASAADRYWDGGDANGGNNVISGTGLGGSGNWDQTTLNWWDGSAASDIAWTDSNVAIFSGTAGTATIPGLSATASVDTRTVTGLTFNTDGFIIGATGTSGTLGATARGILTLTGAANVSVPTGVKATITAKLSGTVGMNISGGGTLRLAEPDSVSPNFGGLNNQTGNVTVSSASVVNATTPGTVLEVIGGGQLGNSTPVSVMTLNGGTYRNLDPTPTGSSFGFTTGTSRPWQIGANGGVFDTPIASSIFLNTAIISGGAGTVLTKIGPGEVRMSSTTPATQINTFEKLVINEGRFTAGQAISLGNDVQLGAVPANYLADAITIDGMTSSPGAILRFAGGDTTTTVTTNVNRGITLGTTYGGLNTIQAGDTNAAIPAIITGPGGFTKIGALNLTLGGANTYLGSTTVTAGILILNNSTGSGVSSGAVTVASGANLRILTSTGSQGNGGVSVTGTLSGTGTLNGPLTMNSGGKIIPGIGGANAVLTVPNADLSTGATLQSTLGNTGTSDVLKVATPSTGLNLNGGLVSLVPVGTTNPSGQSYTLIDYTTGYTGNVNSLLVNNLTGFDGTTIVDDPTNHIIKANIGTVVNDRTWVRESDFGLWNSDAPPATESFNWAKPDNTNPATAANGVGAIARFPAVSPLTLNAIPSQTVTIADANKTLGTLNLDNPNSFTFAAGLAGLRLNMQTYTGNAAINVTQGTHTFNAGVTLTSPTNINLSANTSLTFTVNATSNAAGMFVDTAANSTFTTAPVTNTGGFTKTGPGKMIININDWTGTGATNINGGTLQYTSDNAPGLSNSSTVTVAAGATLDFNSGGAQIFGVGGTPGVNGVGDTIGALAGSGTLLNNRNLTLNGTNASPVVFSGTIGISSALGGNDFFSQDATHQAIVRQFTKTGTGSQTIGGTLEATGNYTVGILSGGTLILNNTAGSLTTSAGTMTLSTAGTTLGGTGTLLGPVVMASGTILSPGSGGIGTLTLKGATALTLPVGSLMSFDIGTGGADKIDASTSAVSIATSTTTKINLVQSGTITPGTYTLIDYATLAGTAAANPLTGLSLGTQPAGFSYTLNNDTGLTAITLTIASLTIPGDANNDGKVDAADYVLIRKANPDITTGAGLTAYNTWRANYGTGVPGAGNGGGLGSSAVPEPTALLLAVFGVFFTGMVRRRR